ncbi:MAG TPA: hypothetical protein VFZ61_32025 [Polyangiales bacterium]
MTQSDDKPRGPNFREASRLRATLGSEPSSGYAFHDQARVDRVERPRAPRSAREHGLAQALAGGVVANDLIASNLLKVDLPGHEPGRTGPGWPSLPQVPHDLQGSAEELLESPFGSRPPSQPAPGRSTPPSAKKSSSNPPAGGAIWQAMPSVIELPESGEDLEADEETMPARPTSVRPRSAPPLSAPPVSPASLVSTDPPRNSRPVGFRPSAAELEADSHYRAAYRDPRLLKYEGLVERNAWEQLHDEISRERAPSPELRLLAIVAKRESLKGDKKQEAARLTQEAISAVAELLHVPPASPTALVIGKRLLRKNPLWSSPKQQPTTGMSLGVLIGGLAAGAGVGWLVTTFWF